MAESVERRGGAQQWHTKCSAVQRGEGVQQCSSSAGVSTIFSVKSLPTQWQQQQRVGVMSPACCEITVAEHRVLPCTAAATQPQIKSEAAPAPQPGLGPGLTLQNIHMTTREAAAGRSANITLYNRCSPVRGSITPAHHSWG